MFYFTKFLVSVLSNSWHVFLGKCMKITAMHKSKINTLHHFNYDSCWAYKLLEFSAQLIGTMLHVSTHTARLKVRVTGMVLIKIYCRVVRPCLHDGVPLPSATPLPSGPARTVEHKTRVNVHLPYSQQQKFNPASGITDLISVAPFFPNRYMVIEFVRLLATIPLKY